MHRPQDEDNVLISILNSSRGDFGGVIHLREEHKIAVEKLLGMPEDYELATMVLIGVKGEEPGERRGEVRPVFSWLRKNRFGNSTTL